ncbi:MAG: PBP1A family penicillin-binding protein [Alphaproteobacteria bacterium]|nr:PBP1A family penicillin-binding protein [Alphaproteobacteria bacterium]
MGDSPSGQDFQADPDERSDGGRRRARAERGPAEPRRSLLGRLFGRGRGKGADKDSSRRQGRDRDFHEEHEEPSGARETAQSRGEKSFRGGGSRSDSARRKRRSISGRLFYWSFVLGVWCTIGAAGLIAYHATQLPPIHQLAVPKRPPNIAIYSEDGVLLANRGDTGGPAIQLRELPPYLPKAFISIEDHRFYSHWGIDALGVGRALYRNATRQGSMEGGSSITQQLAKNLFLTQERTMSRKIQEAILAVWLERKYSKDQILELYLNRVYFGSGAYGVEAASQRYFGKSARQATLPEAAILAGLMKAPSRLAPNRNPEGASARAAQVITAMAREGHITEAMAKLALSRPAGAKTEKGAGSINYAADYVMDMLDETVGAIETDLIVSTTINPALQRAAEIALAAQLAKSEHKQDVSQGAVISLSPGGEIRALVGGRDYSQSQFNRAIAARRQPGSAFKPFVFLAALERGLRPDSRRLDAPVNVRGWKPENASRNYHGEVTLTRALALSLNTVSVRLALEMGPQSVISTARKLGVASPLNANASIALGTSEVTPLELIAAYAPFANGGIRIQPHIITQVKTASGKVLYRRKGASFGRVIEPQNVAMMNAMMQETLLTGTARRAELTGWQAAGKTGTSQDYRDAWFVGYTSYMITGVWLGNDDSSPTKRVSGGNLPVDIWSTVMREAHKGLPPQFLPSGTWGDPARAAPAPTPPRPPQSIPDAIAAAPSNSDRTRAIPANGPMTINRAGQAINENHEGTQRRNAAQAQPVRSAPRNNDLIPPAPVGAGRGNQIPQNDRSLLQRMFGG